MKKYKRTFDNLKVPEDMAQRVTRAMKQEKKGGAFQVRKRRRWLGGAACAACLLLVLGLWRAGVLPTRQNQETPSPVTLSQQEPSLGAEQGKAGNEEPDTGEAPSAPSQSGAHAAAEDLTEPQTARPQPDNPAQTASPQTQTPACGENTPDTEPEEGDNSVVLTPNPVQELESPEGFSQYLTFTPVLPSDLPQGYAAKSYAVLAGELAQVTYSDGSTQIVYRTALGAKEISGDSTLYPENRTVVTPSGHYQMMGDRGRVFLVTWQNEACSYSLSFTPAAAENTALSWAERVTP